MDRYIFDALHSKIYGKAKNKNVTNDLDSDVKVINSDVKSELISVKERIKRRRRINMQRRRNKSKINTNVKSGSWSLSWKWSYLFMPRAWDMSLFWCKSWH